MKQNAFIKKSGPYKVDSFSQIKGGVRLVIYPAFPRYGNDWAITREEGEGGGPGIYTAIALAKTFEEFLNQPYSEEAVRDWKEVIDKVIKTGGRKYEP